MQTDPIGTSDDNNLYAYAAADPANLLDPTGMRNCLPEDPSCIETPESEKQPGDPEPKSDEETEMEEVVVTAEREDKADFVGTHEDFFVVEHGEMTKREMERRQIRCSAVNTVYVGLPGSLAAGQMGAHSHGNELEQHPGPRDDSAALGSSLGVAGMFTQNRSFTIRAFSNGTFRTRQASGPALSGTERSALVSNMQNWEQNPGSPGQSLRSRVCGN